MDPNKPVSAPLDHGVTVASATNDAADMLPGSKASNMKHPKHFSTFLVNLRGFAQTKTPQVQEDLRTPLQDS